MPERRSSPSSIVVRPIGAREPALAALIRDADVYLVGSVAAKTCEYDVRFAEIKRLYVRDSHRGLGLAKRLMECVERHVQAQGLDLVRLETGIKQPEAIGLYRRLGYTERAEFGPYRADPLSVFMEKRLSSG